MREVHKVALSNISSALKETAYELAKHHKQPLPDWDTLPFPVRLSREFRIPAVASALRVQELSIVHSQEIGSHTLFLGHIVSEEHLAQGTQLHHTPGFYQAYRRRENRPFTEI